MANPELDTLVERLLATNPFVNDMATLKPRRNNPDGPAAVDALAALAAENARLLEALEALVTAVDWEAIYIGNEASDAEVRRRARILSRCSNEARAALTEGTNDGAV
jgi:hypothetical protein